MAVSTIGRFGFGVVGGEGHEFQLFGNRIVQGMLVGAPTNASTQVTGTGAYDYNVNIAAGLLVCNDVVKEYAAQADYDVDHGAAANLVVGQSIVYSIVAYRSKGDGEVRLLSIPGVVATTGSQVAPPTATIEAKLADDTFYFKVADVTFNRTGDEAVTYSVNNAVRPTMVPTKG